MDIPPGRPLNLFEHIYLVTNWSLGAPMLAPSSDSTSHPVLVTGGGKRYQQDNAIRKAAITRAIDVAQQLISYQQATRAFSKPEECAALLNSNSAVQARQCVIAALNRAGFTHESAQVAHLPRSSQHEVRQEPAGSAASRFSQQHANAQFPHPIGSGHVAPPGRHSTQHRVDKPLQRPQTAPTVVPSSPPVPQPPHQTQHSSPCPNGHTTFDNRPPLQRRKPGPAPVQSVSTDTNAALQQPHAAQTQTLQQDDQHHSATRPPRSQHRPVSQTGPPPAAQTIAAPEAHEEGAVTSDVTHGLPTTDHLYQTEATINAAAIQHQQLQLDELRQHCLQQARQSQEQILAIQTEVQAMAAMFQSLHTTLKYQAATIDK
eukprot:6171332-Amphidinium_carterae.1